MKLERKALGAVLLCAAFGSNAMTLGRVRGTALIGQPLDLTIPVQFDAEENAASLCVEADVFHADARQEPGRVKVTVESTSQAQTAMVRVVSAQAVDEPMVTVYLKAGCDQKITRRYVLLADYPSEVALAATTAVGQTSPVAPKSTPMSPPGATGEPKIGSTWAEVEKSAAPAAKAKDSVAAKPVIRKEKPKVAPPKASEPVAEKVAAVEKRLAGKAAGQSRLKLDPLEVLSERVATLESSKVIAPVPDDVVKDAMRFQSLEGDVKALLALAAKNEASMLEMKTRLQKAESERFANWLVYALIAAISLCAGALIFLWNRQKSAMAAKGDWWRGSAEEIAKTNANAPTTAIELETPAATLDVFDPNAEHASPAAAPSRVMGHEAASTVDLNLSEISASTFDSLLQSSPASMHDKPAVSPITAPKPASTPSINADEVFDVRQQADFFVSLGQTDQAIRVLESHIAENAESSPILYLDLLQLFHSLSLKTDFRQFRDDFNLLFNAHIPEFAFFKQEGQGLEAYADVLSDITALWSSPKVLALIEGCIFKSAWDDRGRSFDLAAFRELLLLHAMAQSEHDSASGSGDARRSSFAHLSPNRFVSSGLGGARPAYFQNTNQAGRGAIAENSVDTDLDAYQTRVETPLPSIDASSLDLDLDLNVTDAGQLSKRP
ncbi:MAG: hypothetical protein RIS34_1648 [Pseudomonadota bacterium]